MIFRKTCSSFKVSTYAELWSRIRAETIYLRKFLPIMGLPVKMLIMFKLLSEVITIDLGSVVI